MKRYNKIICLVLIFISLFLLTSCVCASDNSTDSIDTANNSEFNDSSKSGVDLNNLINGNESEDEIVLDDDFVFDMTKDGFDLSGIKINRSVSIDGQGHTIDGINYYRVFDISADNVVLKNIIFINSSYGRNSYNAVIFKNSTGVSIINTTFINCGDSYSNGAISFEDSSRASIINSTFIRNNGWHGGAVYFENSYGFIMNSTFIGNSGAYGGSVYFGTGSNGTIVNSSFYENNATKNMCKAGGAVFCNGYDITIDDCIFAKNKAIDGGAVSYYGSKGSVTNSIFINNYARQGGGSIMCYGRNISIVNCTFNASSVKFYGGAIFYIYSYRNSVINSTFIGNNATYGGGIYFKDKSHKAIVKNCVFKENYAEYGAAICASNQTSKNIVLNSIFIENKAKHNGTIYGIKFQNCTIIKIQTQLFAKQINSYYNEDKYSIIQLKDKNGVKMANVNVNVDCGGVVKSLITNKQGEIKFSTKNLIPKSYKLKISFLGNDFYEKTSIFSKIIIKKPNLKLIAKQKKFKSKTKTKKYSVYLKNNFNNPIKKTKLLLKVNGQKYKSTTNKNGKAIFKKIKLTKKGKYNAKVIFKGNEYYKSAIKNVKIFIK